MKKHLVFVINQKSGVDRQKAVQNAIDKKLDKEQFTYEIQYTEYPKHGREIAATAAEKGAYAVVAVGGDGSVNDIVTGLLDSDTALAVIPKGSGNGLAHSMKIPLKTEAAIEVINKGNSVMMDIGYANGQPFVSNAGVAFVALISDKFKNSTKRGLVTYAQLVMSNLINYKEEEWEIIIDGETIKQESFIVSVANGKHFGYNFQIAPDASWTDGLFDVVIVKKFNKLLGTGLVLRTMNGTITKSNKVLHYRAKEVIVRHPELDLMQTDGDAYPCKNEVVFKMDEAKQKVLIP